MREIVFDTETTGLRPLDGDRVVEIGCVELINHVTTGNVYHVYINPERDVPDEVVRVHGLTKQFLSDKPVFSEIVDGFLEFIGESTLVAHNAAFDMGFINAEFVRLGFPRIPDSRVIDTLKIARKKFFGAPATLDALCKRFDIDTSSRTLHGALLDAQLLADVYLELCGGRQPDFVLGESEKQAEAQEASNNQKTRPYHEPREFPPTAEELAAHEAFLEKLKNPLWRAGGVPPQA